MKTRIVTELARIASEKYQYEYVLHATKDEYVVPEELVDTVRGTFNTIMKNPTLAKSLSDSQMEALKRFEEVAARTYAELPWDSTTTAADILESAGWHELRRAAVECLREFSVRVEDWEASMQ